MAPEAAPPASVAVLGRDAALGDEAPVARRADVVVARQGIRDDADGALEAVVAVLGGADGPAAHVAGRREGEGLEVPGADGGVRAREQGCRERAAAARGRGGGVRGGGQGRRRRDGARAAGRRQVVLVLVMDGAGARLRRRWRRWCRRHVREREQRVRAAVPLVHARVAEPPSTLVADVAAPEALVSPGEAARAEVAALEPQGRVVRRQGAPALGTARGLFRRVVAVRGQDVRGLERGLLLFFLICSRHRRRRCCCCFLPLGRSRVSEPEPVQTALAGAVAAQTQVPVPVVAGCAVVV